MKMMKKFAALGLAVALTLGMSVTALAYDVPTGQGGSKTIQVTNASKGETYEIYKVFTATVDGSNVAYKSDVAIAENAGLSFYTDDKMNVILKDEEQTELSKKDIEWLNDNKEKFTKVGTTTNDKGEDTIDFSGLTDGYYYVTTTQGTLVSVDSTTANVVEIVDKNTSDPTPGPDDPKKANADSKTIGEDVEYTIKFTATNYNEAGTKIYNYKVVDTSSQVKIDDSTIDIKVDGKDPVVDAAIDYTDGELTITIPWTTDGTDEGNHLYKSGVLVEITYTAEILALDAKNDVTFNWNDSEQFGTGTSTVENYDFNLNKVAEDGTTSLDGAEFTLEKADGTLIEFVKDEDGNYVVAGSDIADANKTTTITAGAVNIDGLGAGTYTLTETKSPNGYNLLTTPLEITIGEDGTVTFDGENGKDISVVNYAGTELPSTGGIGTTIFYVVGGVLVIAAVVLLVTKKRMSNRA